MFFEICSRIKNIYIKSFKKLKIIKIVQKFGNNNKKIKTVCFFYVFYNIKVFYFN